MTLTIELPDTLSEPLKAVAFAQGISPDRYVSEIVKLALSISAQTETASDSAQHVKPVWEMVLDTMRDVPSDVFDRLPRDGAAEHDHYIYGTPKRYS